MARPRPLTLLMLPLALLLSAACSAGAGPTSATAAGQPSQPPAATLRLGYFANVTHVTPVVGVAKGTFQQALGSTKLETQIFNAGPAAIEALFAGSLDAAYLGPGPAINGYAKSGGNALRIIAGATTGGASLVVRPGHPTAASLKGTTLATPQLGGTQDVALRAWLAGNGLQTSPTGGGDVTIAPQDNASTLDLFKAKKIDGAWVPEPWASRLVVEGGGSVLVDERSTWPAGQFVTTHLVVAAKYLKEHPATVKALLRGTVETNQQIKADPAGTKQVVQSELTRLSGKPLLDAVYDRAIMQIEVSDDPVASSLATSAKKAQEAGLLAKVDLKGIYDLTLLNQVLADKKLPAVDAAGLGV